MAQLILALDYPDAKQAMAMAAQVAGEVPWVKVGLELFTASGPGVVRELKKTGFKVFLDLKCLDIPNTVAGAVRSAASLGADMLTLHASGGRRMLEAAVAARDQAAAVSASDETAGHRLMLFAVSVLTSQDNTDLGLEAPSDVAALVLERARLAASCGLDGVVCSGLEVTGIKNNISPSPLCLTPGIRPAGTDDDQRRVVTPARAVADGSDFLVVGRPITRAHDPAGAARAILAQMADSAV